MTTHPTDSLRLVPVSLISDTMNTMARAYERIHSMPRVSDTELAKKVDEAKERLRPYLAAPASPLPEGGGRQDISTAPMDGTVIDLWASEQRCADCKWSEETPNGFSDAVGGPGWVQLDCDVTGSWHWSLIGVAPTHWMPLHAAPTGAK